jgi:hypothetical protein
VQLVYPGVFAKFLRANLPLSEGDCELFLSVVGQENCGQAVALEDLDRLLRNYLRKEQLYQACLDEDLRFDLVRERGTLEVLLSLRRASAHCDQFSDIIEPRSYIKEQLVQIGGGGPNTAVEVIDMADFTTFLGNPHQPPQVVKELQGLFSIDPRRYPRMLLINKMNRVISPDLDAFQVNLLRQVDHHRQQQNDMIREEVLMEDQESSATNPLGEEQSESRW